MKPPEWDNKLWAELFGEKNLRIIRPERQQAPAQRTAPEIQTQKLSPLEEKKSLLRPCGIFDFTEAVCRTYYMGDMDRYSPYPQVWFSAVEAVQLLETKGYALSKEQARSYLLQLMKFGLVEDRDNITAGVKEYRHTNFMQESLDILRRKLRVRQ